MYNMPTFDANLTSAGGKDRWLDLSETEVRKKETLEIIIRHMVPMYMHVCHQLPSRDAP